ncbi:MAG TPA: MATE family efflux transporter [Crinalium sp.]|jgi:MATE family multidrug resistance protein
MGVQAEVRTEIKACLQLAIPLAGAQLSQAANGFADTLMMGLLGSQALAAGGLGSAAFMALYIISTGVLSAVSPLVAEAHGADRPDRVRQVAIQGVWLAVLIAIPLTLVIWHIDALMPYLGQEPENAVMAGAYLKAIAWGVLPGLAFAALEHVVAALSQPRPIMAIMVGGTMFNVGANYVLMFGKFGLPALGLAGIGWATTLTYWLMLLSLGLYIANQPSLRRYRIFRHLLQFDWRTLWEVTQVGIPIGLLFAFETGLFTVTTFLMGYLGTTTLAAHQIALRTASITFMVPLGIAYATTVRVGQLIGQNNPLGARLAGFVGMGLGGLFMATMGLLVWLAPRAIASLYLDINDPANQPVIDSAIALLGVAALFQVFDGVQVVASGALRGLKDTRIPMLLGIFSYWGIGLTSGCLLGLRWHLGGVGLWLGLAIGLAIASFILSWRFRYLTTPKTAL